MEREGIISYLNSMKNSEDSDPLHKWVGTYNSRLWNLTRFFKWFYSPTEAYLIGDPNPNYYITYHNCAGKKLRYTNLPTCGH